MKHISRLFIISIILSGLLGIPVKPVRAASVYKTAEDGGGTACTESAPCSLQTAANLASDGSVVYVEGGTYTVTSGDEVAKFDNTVTIIGSCQYDGNDATVPDCGLETFRSVIDGDYTRRGLTLTGTSASRKSFYLHHLDIKNGDANEVDVSACTVNMGYVNDGCGGGVFINYGNIVYINDFYFDYNFAAGYNDDMAGFGGGVYVQNSYDVAIVNSKFFGNPATWLGMGFGGGVFATNVSAEFSVVNSEFNMNTCTTTDSTESRGCGIMVHDSSNVIINQNTFYHSNPLSAAGVLGSAVFMEDNDGFAISENTFEGNSGTSVVGAVNDSSSTPDKIDANYFRNNAAYKLIQYQGKYFVLVRNNFLLHRTSTTLRGGPTYTAIDLTSDYTSPSKSTASIYYNSIYSANYGMNIGDNLSVSIKNNIITYTDRMGILLPDYPTNFSGQYQTNLFYQNTGGDGIYDPTSVNANPGFIGLG